MRTTIPWGDGTGDNIYLDYNASAGDQSVAVSSDANTGSARTKVVTFSAAGATPVSLTVNQAMGLPPGANFLVYGTPTISNGIMIPDQNNIGFIYCNKSFNPQEQEEWIIQTKIRMLSNVAYRDVISSVNAAGASIRSIELQQTTGRNASVFLSNNGTSWNISNSNPTASLPQVNNSWYKFQLVCSYVSGSSPYRFKFGYPDSGSWSSTKAFASHPTYGVYISFGGGLTRGINAEFDLSETKIFIGGQLWWEAITSNQ